MTKLNFLSQCFYQEVLLTYFINILPLTETQINQIRSPINILRPIFHKRVIIIKLWLYSNHSLYCFACDDSALIDTQLTRSFSL